MKKFSLLGRRRGLEYVNIFYKDSSKSKKKIKITLFFFSVGRGGRFWGKGGGQSKWI